MKNIFITGIGTDVGKTTVSAIFVEAFGYDYWKPVQSGNLNNTDSDCIRRLVTRKDITIYPEAFCLTLPLSPHAAAKADNKRIRLTDLKLPSSDGRPMIIEGAGGVMVPLNHSEFMVDLIQKLAVEVVLVSRNYLGSINHSMLTFEALQSRKIPVRGWIINGQENPETEKIIEENSGKKILFRIGPEQEITPEVIKKYAEGLKTKWNG